MRIFLSYSSQNRARAEEIALALQAQGHHVFFDRKDLEAGGDYNRTIRDRIASADLLIFLVSPAAIREGAYTLTELRFAKEKWQHPGRSVLPVVVEATPLSEIPAYLRSVTLLEPEGNLAAEVAAAVSARRRKPHVRPLTMGALLVVTGVSAAVAFWANRETPWQPAIRAEEFLTRYVYPDDAIEREFYALDPAFRITGDSVQVLRVTRVAYGSVNDSLPAMNITILFRNMTAAPLQMDFDHRFFRLTDDQDRRGTLVYFCCTSDASLLDPERGREMQLIFTAHPGWSGKEVQARYALFQVNGLLPVTSATWRIPALAAAAR